MILIIDNYDSFTYNLVQRIGELDTPHRIVVRRNDEVTLDDIDTLRPTHLIISPGPRTPHQSGISMQAIRRWGGSIPILGVCLGHQCIAQAFGGCVVRAHRLMHGRTSAIEHDGRTIFAELPNPLTATRYHSLAVAPASLPAEFEITASTDNGREIMGIRHRTVPLEGVQFHPESYLTPAGSRLLKNFCAM